MKTFEQCCDEAAKKYPKDAWFRNHVVTIKEICDLYASEICREKVREELDANNVAHKSATKILVEEAVKLAQQPKYYQAVNVNSKESFPVYYTLSEILVKLKL